MRSSPYLYKLMGISFTRSVVDKKLNPEHKLWRAVVINAFDDTMITLSDRKSSVQKIEAHNWILQESREYNRIYKALFYNINNDQKKLIRKRLDELRKEIHNTATTYTDSIILEAL